MMRQLSTRHQQMAAWALAALAGVFVYLVAGAPLVDRFGYYDERAADLGGQLARFEKIAADRAVEVEGLERFSRNDVVRTYYLASDNAALASAELQQYVENAVDSSGATLISTQVMGVSEAAGLPQLTIKVRLRGNIDMVQETLYSLEHSRPLLFLDEVTISAPSSARRSRDSVDTGELNVAFDAIGYMRKRSDDETT